MELPKAAQVRKILGRMKLTGPIRRHSGSSLAGKGGGGGGCSARKDPWMFFETSNGH